MWICYWFVLFIIYSGIGWVYETIYCTIRGKKWDNRGFLYGPICTIYGAGAVASSALMVAAEKYNVSYSWWHVFLIGFFGSIVLEYSTHWTLEKIFHAYWWDYSNRPFNIKGRICLPCSLAFGGAALLVVYYIAPFVMGHTAGRAPVMYEFLSLFIMLFLGMDIALTVSALTDFENRVAAAEETLNNHMIQFVDGIGAKYGQVSGQMGDKIAEEKDKFSRENVLNTVRQMNEVSRAAVRRIKGVVTNRKNEITVRARLLEAMKNFKRDKGDKPSGEER